MPPNKYKLHTNVNESGILQVKSHPQSRIQRTASALDIEIPWCCACMHAQRMLQIRTPAMSSTIKERSVNESVSRRVWMMARACGCWSEAPQGARQVTSQLLQLGVQAGLLRSHKQAT